MADRTETLLRSQRELLQLVSHELRTPLARIRFATDLIESSKTDEERRMRLEAVDNATQELDELVGELLTYVRLESDAPTIEPERIDLTSLLPELVKIHAPLHPAIQYECDSADKNVQVTADHASLSRAIGNLLSNAGRFAEQRVTVRAYEQNDTIVVQVDDDGPGVPEADRDKIFGPFVRLENADRGAGLGLALVKRIATGHRGSVTVSESPSGGARFSLFLPAR
jgi:two-component system sensor histidine kinase RstB